MQVPRERERPDEVPWREIEHGGGMPEMPESEGVGHARSEWWWPEPTEAQQEEWRAEDKEREQRRIPLGFQ